MGRPKLSRNNEGRSGAGWRAAKAAMRRTWGDTCHLCGHAGATEADHVIPRQQWMASGRHGDDPANLRPAHGTSCPCPTCGQRCNQQRKRKARPEPVRAPRQRTPVRNSRVW